MKRSGLAQLNKLICGLLLCVVLLGSLCPVLAVPADGCSLTIDYRHEDLPVAEAVFRLYRIADLDSELQLKYTEAFSDLQLDAKALQDSDELLLSRVAEQNLPPEHTLTLDSEGKGKLSGITPGAFLLVGEPATLGEYTYYVDHQVVFLPSASQQGSELQYHVTLCPKSTRLPVGTELIGVKAVKLWSDKGYEQERPKSIRVRLLKDGKTVSTAVLSETNGWSHTWSDLLPNARWTVQEDVPKGYVVEISEKDHVFTLTNHRKNIEQTGAVWWPVVTVLGAGLVLIIVGVLLRRSVRYEA